jgi:heat shock protein HslJ/membrane-bound inhibitor of C-type lysozyme
VHPPLRILCSSVALLGLAACSAPPAAAPAAATWATLQCGDRPASVVFDADGALLSAGADRVALAPVVSASGARYEALADSTTWLWNKGAATMLSLRGVVWPDCRSVAAPPFRALGQEPGWLLNIDGASARLTLGMGSEVVTAALTEPRVTRSTRSYSAEGSAGPMTVVVTDRPCADSMSGMPHPATVQVAVRGQVFKGCGGEPAALLVGTEWRVLSIAGQAPATGSSVTLSFAADGSLSGQTGCNRFNSRFQLTGEGLKINPAATTRMACPAPLMAQEGLVLDLLGAVNGFDIGADGALVLRTADGRRLIAQRP